MNIIFTAIKPFEIVHLDTNTFEQTRFVTIIAFQNTRKHIISVVYMAPKSANNL